MISPGATIVVALAALGLYALYRGLLPKPLPGIPYNPAATRSLFGDIPNVLAEMQTTGDPSWASWMLRQIAKHNSPLCQVFFTFPFYKPAVILADAREAQDVMLRRTKEFDRSQFVTDLLGGLIPNHHVLLHTNGKWKAQRRLLQDLMTPSFLRGVASGVIYDRATELVRLWETKMDIAAGRPFLASGDIFHSALDSVLGFSFGDTFRHGAVGPKLKHLSSLTADEKTRISAAGGIDDPVEFPDNTNLDEEITATLDLCAAVEKMYGAGFPGLTWWLMEKMSLRKAVAVRNRYVRKELENAASRLQGQGDDESWVRSAVDQMVAREKKLAQKDGRKPDFFSSMIQDEVFGFIVGGHDTTSTTLLWSLKLLADHPDMQKKLRNLVRDAFPAALSERRLPTVSEIHDTTIPYLDATVDELIRCSRTVSFPVRDAMRDTVLLGHCIPKGTTVFLAGAGPGFLLPSLQVNEQKRSESSRNAKKQPKIGSWNEADIEKFNPDRWLVPAEKPEHGAEYDAMAGPQLTFGLGLRGCFGRKLAYLEMRTLVALIVWRFVLQPCPKELSGYEAVDGITHKPRTCYVRLQPSY